jgi:hypothetical protein
VSEPSSFSRYAEMMDEHRMVPFHREPWVNPRTGKVDPRVLGPRPKMRWRVSQDEWDRLVEETRQFGWPMPVEQAHLGGFPIAVDDALPPNSVIFEPSPASQETETR